MRLLDNGYYRAFAPPSLGCVGHERRILLVMSGCRLLGLLLQSLNPIGVVRMSSMTVVGKATMHFKGSLTAHHNYSFDWPEPQYDSSKGRAWKIPVDLKVSVPKIELGDWDSFMTLARGDGSFRWRQVFYRDTTTDRFYTPLPRVENTRQLKDYIFDCAQTDLMRDTMKGFPWEATTYAQAKIRVAKKVAELLPSYAKKYVSTSWGLGLEEVGQPVWQVHSGYDRFRVELDLSIKSRAAQLAFAFDIDDKKNVERFVAFLDDRYDRKSVSVFENEAVVVEQSPDAYPPNAFQRFMRALSAETLEKLQDVPLPPEISRALIIVGRASPRPDEKEAMEIYEELLTIDDFIKNKGWETPKSNPKNLSLYEWAMVRTSMHFGHDLCFGQQISSTGFRMK